MQDRKMTDKLCSCCKIKQQRTIRLNYFTCSLCSHHQYKLRRKCLGMRPVVEASEQHGNFPLHCLLVRNYTVVTYTQAFWPDRTLVDPLLVNVRDQLLQIFHVLAVISNLWANVTDSLHHFTSRQHR